MFQFFFLSFSTSDHNSFAWHFLFLVAHSTVGLLCVTVLHVNHKNTSIKETQKECQKHTVFNKHTVRALLSNEGKRRMQEKRWLREPSKCAFYTPYALVLVHVVCTFFLLQWMIQARTLAMIHCDDPMMHVTVMAAIRDYVLSCVCCFAHIFPIELV